MTDQKFIKMRRADWEQWDAALRSGDYVQGPEELHGNHGGIDTYCCLGVLECALGGVVEDDSEREDDELPSRDWLEEHNIMFIGKNKEGKFAAGERAPYLPKLGKSAAEANDEIYIHNNDAVHKFDFIAIADAIKDTVEFTDA